MVRYWHSQSVSILAFDTSSSLSSSLPLFLFEVVQSYWKIPLYLIIQHYINVFCEWELPTHWVCRECMRKILNLHTIFHKRLHRNTYNANWIARTSLTSPVIKKLLWNIRAENAITVNKSAHEGRMCHIMYITIIAIIQCAYRAIKQLISINIDFEIAIEIKS